MYHRRVFDIGSSLREARLRTGYDLSEAEAATKIRTKYLKALEEERFELLPAEMYVKGFLRSYAEFLGLDGGLYVDEYNSRYGSEEAEHVARSRRQRPSRAHRRVESRILVLALLGIAAATALVVIAWKWGGTEPATVPNLQTRDSPAAEGAGAPTAPQPAVTLVLKADAGDSWIAVRRGSGQGEILFEGTLERAGTRVFTGKRLWLNVSLPENLSARLNGKQVKLPKRGQPVVLVVTKKGLKPAA
jgi:cytoskeleton protein RodZ